MGFTGAARGVSALEHSERVIELRTHTPLIAIASISTLVMLACGADTGPRPKLSDIAVEVSKLVIDERSGTPILILGETRGDRELPIWIGFAEARSIASEMRRREPVRPNTHDLTKRLLDELSGDVERVVVTELRNGTYYAVVVLRVDGTAHEVDSRPSDAIALGLRYGAPLFVRETLFESIPDLPSPGSDERSI